MEVVMLIITIIGTFFAFIAVYPVIVSLLNEADKNTKSIHRAFISYINNCKGKVYLDNSIRNDAVMLMDRKSKTKNPFWAYRRYSLRNIFVLYNELIRCILRDSADNHIPSEEEKIKAREFKKSLEKLGVSTGEVFNRLYDL